MGTCVLRRSRTTSARIPASVVPPFRARSLARWMVGPSATGSLNGTPSSITSAPASAAASAIFSVASSDGSPAVMYATRPSWPASASSRKRRPMRPPVFPASVCAAEVDLGIAASDIAGESVHVFIAAAGKIQYDDLILLHFRSPPRQLRNRVRGFKRGNNPFGPREHLCRRDGIVVHHRGVFG